MGERLTYINGSMYRTNEATVPVEDRAFQFADGVYEVIRVYKGQLFAKKRHLTRMERSATKIRIDFAQFPQELEEVLEKLLFQSGVKTGQLYLQLTRGVSPRLHAFPSPGIAPTLVATISDLPMRTLHDFERGEKAIVVKDDRWLHCDIKSTSLLPNVLAKQTAVDHGADEAILARENRFITEGSSSNVFIVKNQTVYTHPDNDYVLPGITKELIREISHNQSIPFVEEVFTTDDLYNADEVFITSTTHDICPILSVDNRQVGDSKPGPVTRELSRVFLDLYNLADLASI